MQEDGPNPNDAITLAQAKGARTQERGPKHNKCFKARAAKTNKHSQERWTRTQEARATAYQMCQTKAERQKKSHNSECQRHGNTTKNGKGLETNQKQEKVCRYLPQRVVPLHVERSEVAEGGAALIAGLSKQTAAHDTLPLRILGQPLILQPETWRTHFWKDLGLMQRQRMHVTRA